MNTSYSTIDLSQLPPSFAQLSHDFPRALVFLLIPVELLYFSIYFHLKGYYRTYVWLSFASIAAFWLSKIITPIACGPAECLQNFAVAIGTMKILDIFARRHSLPEYTAGKRPADWLLPIIVITELRYESFTPNHIRIDKKDETFSEPMQLGIHLLAFVVLQSLPQIYPTVLAFEVLLSIYIIWTSMQLVLRYKSSPALFGPLYRADSLSGFWSETWHNAFASPCTSLGYKPLRTTLPKFGIPVPLARAMGVLGAFVLMAIFHIYALAPIMSRDGLRRIGIFFLLNGVGTCTEALIWGKKKHWVKAVLAWGFETALATWTAAGAGIPNGLSHIPWRDVCVVRG